MNDSFESFYEEEGLFESINRFEEMASGNGSCYFDVYEFENIIDYYIDQHNFNQAKAAIDRGLKQHPNSSSFKLRLAHIYIQNGKPSKGLHLLREIEPLEAANADFYLLKGTALNVLGKREGAHNAFDKAIQLTTENKDDVIFSVAYSYLNTRRYKLAIKYLSLALEINPDNLSVVQELALVYEKTDELEKSIEYYKKYLELDPFAEHIWFSLGMVYSTREENDLAIDAYDYAIAICPDYISAYFSKANTLINIKNYKEALESYQQIISIEPDNVQAYTYVGECYDKLELYKRAIYYFRKALVLDKNCGDAWYGLGMAYYNMEEYSNSLDYFAYANKIDPENPDFWFMLGEAYRKLNILDKSAESFHRAVELDPNDYEAWLSHADIFFMENKLNEAITVLNKAYQYNNEISTINYNLAVYYLYDNQPQLAVKYFEKGLSINFSEHNELLDRYPITSKSEVFSQLIKKYKNLSQ
jgi:tetratricopeptide (TPR) repeat protein